MAHPTDGTLRRLLDEPAAVADPDRAHVAGCATCRAALDAVRRDAASAAAVLAPAPHAGTGSDTDAAWHRLTAALAADAAPEPRAVSRVRPAPARWRRLVQRPAVAAAGVAVVIAGAGAAAAADWVPIFRTEVIAPVTVTQEDLLALPDLSAYGDLDLSQPPAVGEVADAATAQDETGLAAPEVADLPQGVAGDPAYQVADRVEATFTFSVAEARAAAAAAGESLPEPPAGLDGARFRLEAGPGVAAVWQSGSGLPGLVVARAVAPAASSSGTPFVTARDYLLSLPGMPADLAAQLRGYTGDGTTLPLPVPADQVETAAAEVGGAPATTFTSRDGTLAGVVWVEGGVVTAVAGSMTTDEVLAVAGGLVG